MAPYLFLGCLVFEMRDKFAFSQKKVAVVQKLLSLIALCQIKQSSIQPIIKLSFDILGLRLLLIFKPIGQNNGNIGLIPQHRE